MLKGECRAQAVAFADEAFLAARVVHATFRHFSQRAEAVSPTRVLPDADGNSMPEFAGSDLTRRALAGRAVAAGAGAGQNSGAETNEFEPVS